MNTKFKVKVINKDDIRRKRTIVKYCMYSAIVIFITSFIVTLSTPSLDGDVKANDLMNFESLSVNTELEGIDTELYGYSENQDLSERISTDEEHLQHILDSIAKREEMNQYYTDGIHGISDYRILVTRKEFQLMCEITEAEVTGNKFADDPDIIYQCKIRVPQTMINRVESDNAYFPDTIWDVATQPGAFSTYGSGRYKEVTVTEETKKAVNDALLKETSDYSCGALGFNSLGIVPPGYEKLFVDNVGHLYYK